MVLLVNAVTFSLPCDGCFCLIHQINSSQIMVWPLSICLQQSCLPWPQVKLRGFYLIITITTKSGQHSWIQTCVLICRLAFPTRARKIGLLYRVQSSMFEVFMRASLQDIENHKLVADRLVGGRKAVRAVWFRNCGVSIS